MNCQRLQAVCPAAHQASAVIIVLVLMEANKRAFTLLELLVSIAVILLFSALTLAYYNRQTAAKKLVEDADNLVDVLELAKKKAISGDIGSEESCDFKGYSVTFSGTTYTLKLMCTAAIPIQSYTLTERVSFLSVPAAINFLPLTGSNNTSQTITLSESSNSKTMTVTVDHGNISR